MAIQTGVVDLTTSVVIVTAGVSYHTFQRNFRFRNDDGNETSATWIAPTNTTFDTASEFDRYRVRFSIENTGAAVDQSANQGHLEVSEGGGPYKTLGMDSYSSPVSIPFFDLESVSTFIDETDVAANKGVMFIASNGVWYLASGHGVFAIRISTNNGLTWRKQLFEDPNIDEESYVETAVVVESIIEDAAGAVTVFWSSTTIYEFSSSSINYNTRSITEGVSWEPQYVYPNTGSGISKVFITVNNDYVITEIQHAGALKYHISVDQGVNWTTYQNNDVASDTRITASFYELDSTTGDLTVWYLGQTLNGSTYEDPTYLYKWVDAYPYSGFPNASEDDISQLIFSGSNSISGISAAVTYSNFFTKIHDGEALRVSVSMIKIVDSAFANTSIVYVPELSDYAFKDNENIVSWDISDYDGQTSGIEGPRTLEEIVSGRDSTLFYKDNGWFGIAGGTYNSAIAEAHRTPGFMGWYSANIAAITSSRMDFPFYSPSIDKWFGVDINGSVITCYEYVWSQEADGTHTTQQISSGAYTAVNYGYTHFNTIQGANGIGIPAGDTVEYEYAFQIRTSEYTDGKLVCLRPSGFNAYDNPACFTIPPKEAALAATVISSIQGDTDGPHCYPAVSVIANIIGGVTIPAAVSLPISVTSTLAIYLQKQAAIVCVSNSVLTGSVYLTKPVAAALLSTATINVVTINEQYAAAIMSSTAISSIGEPTIEVPAKTSMLVVTNLSPTANKNNTGAALLRIRVVVVVDSECCKLPISLIIQRKLLSVATGVLTVWDVDASVWDGGITIWDEGATDWDVVASVWDEGATEWDGSSIALGANIDLTIIKPQELTIIDIPANLTVCKAAVPNLIIIKPLPLQVYV